MGSPSSDTTQELISSRPRRNRGPPHKCIHPKCRHRDQREGYATIDNLKRHLRRFHPGTSVGYKCHYPSCTFFSTRNATCRAHMGQVHGWMHDRCRNSRSGDILQDGTIVKFCQVELEESCIDLKRTCFVTPSVEEAFLGPQQSPPCVFTQSKEPSKLDHNSVCQRAVPSLPQQDTLSRDFYRNLASWQPDPSTECTSTTPMTDLDLTTSAGLPVSLLDIHDQDFYRDLASWEPEPPMQRTSITNTTVFNPIIATGFTPYFRSASAELTAAPPYHLFLTPTYLSSSGIGFTPEDYALCAFGL